MSTVLSEGQALGPFLLERKIAVGGMAEIWSALRADTPSGGGPSGRRRFALKVLLEGFGGDAALRTMFIDEVRIAKRLRHPNIVQVEGEYEDRGLIFQAMELIDGRDLRRVLAAKAKARERIPMPLAVRIARETARGLGYAHAARGEDGQPLDIVHRDVSPHNIVIDRQGAVRVLDFGVARARERMTRTAAGVIKGKIAYMAPEQMLAETVTAQSDIFSLGIVLWEMLAMRRLFAGPSDAEIFTAVCEARVPPIDRLVPELPAELAELVSAMLQLRPKNRPETMRVVENRLSRLLSTCWSEQSSSEEALASLMAPLLEEPRKKTAVLEPIAPPTQATQLFVDGPEALPTVGLEVPPPYVRSAEPSALPTEALDVGAEFMDVLRDAPTHTLPPGLHPGDATATTAAPVFPPEALAKTQPYSVERRRELDETVGLGVVDAPRAPVRPSSGEDETRLAPPRSAHDEPDTRPDLDPIDGSGSNLVTPVEPRREEVAAALSAPVGPKLYELRAPARELPAPRLDERGRERQSVSPPAPREAPQERPLRPALRSPPITPLPPESGRFGWIVGGLVVAIGMLFAISKACGA